MLVFLVGSWLCSLKVTAHLLVYNIHNLELDCKLLELSFWVLDCTSVAYHVMLF